MVVDDLRFEERFIDENSSEVIKNNLEILKDTQVNGDCHEARRQMIKDSRYLRCQALVCILSDSSIFKALIIPSTPDITTPKNNISNWGQSDIARQDSEFDNVIKKVLNPLSRLSLQEIIRGDPLQSIELPLILNRQGPPFYSMKGILTTKSDGANDFMDKVPINFVKNTRFYIEKSDTIAEDEELSYNIADNNNIPNTDIAIDSNYDIELIEEDTTHHIDYGTIKFNISEMLTRIYKYRRRYSSIDYQLSDNSETFISMPKSVSTPELSSTYRQKRRQSKNEPLQLEHNSLLLDFMRIESEHFRFYPRSLFQADQAQIIIVKSFGKDLMSKGCLICVGSVEMTHPEKLTSFYHQQLSVTNNNYY
ncbi:unnamed protein product [Gordionus sp. m RMFG-2023]|uniref:uncharacterized protein LOC135928314 n=1 Tax=Gordionus sp. m RMFG-2023 TaxID=3053472 RepID=UPI0030E2C7A6